MSESTVAWSTMLKDAVNQPGVISKCYSTFHNYSIGNQILAYSQLAAREMPLAPIATYKKWSELGRQVKKGSKALALVMMLALRLAIAFSFLPLKITGSPWIRPKAPILPMKW
jgi:hypothetical protein